VLWIRIRPDPYDFAGSRSRSVLAIPDPDLDPAVVILFVVLLLVVFLLVALQGTGDDSFNPLRTWYRGVSYDRVRYPDFSGPSWVTWTYFYFLRLGSGSETGSGSKKFEGSDLDPEKDIRIRNTDFRLWFRAQDIKTWQKNLKVNNLLPASQVQNHSENHFFSVWIHQKCNFSGVQIHRKSNFFSVCKHRKFKK